MAAAYLQNGGTPIWSHAWEAITVPLLRQWSIIGFGVGLLGEYTETSASDFVRFVPKAWNLVLRASAGLALATIVAGCTYVPWHERKYSPLVNTVSDVQKRDKSLTSLRARFLSDDEILLLQKFSQLNYLDFQGGWGAGQVKITDAGLKILSGLSLPKLEQLMLGYCGKISDTGMHHLARIKNLKYLSLAACSQISDDGLSYLARSTSLETLDLRGCKGCKGVTDRGLSYLKHVPRLKEVLLGGCVNITAAGIDELRKALPSCEITKDDQEWSWHTKA